MKIDLEQFNQLRDLDRTGALEQEMLQVFLNDTKDDLENTPTNPKHFAHRIKGRAAQLGFVDVADMACQLQNNPSSTELQERLQEVTKEACEHVKDLLTKSI